MLSRGPESRKALQLSMTQPSSLFDTSSMAEKTEASWGLWHTQSTGEMPGHCCASARAGANAAVPRRHAARSNPDAPLQRGRLHPRVCSSVRRQVRSWQDQSASALPQMAPAGVRSTLSESAALPPSHIEPDAPSGTARLTRISCI